MKITPSDMNNFERDGYIVISDPSLTSLWDRVDNEISELIKFFKGKKINMFEHSGDDIDAKTQSLIYDRLHYLPCLAALSSNPVILDYCRRLGMELPILMGCCNMRYDRPENQKHLFKWHQDSVYLLGSLNAVTIWIPFSKVNKDVGSIAVIPGSHKQGLKQFKIISDKDPNSGLPFLQRDIDLDTNVSEDNEVIIEAERGDLVIFKQMLLHRSVYNKSKTVRWTAQLRISDLACQTYKNNNYRNGDKFNVFQVNFPGFSYETAQNTAR